ncbi:MAG: hypothetical protein PGN24_06545 [Microbacterium arborescens]
MRVSEKRRTLARIVLWFAVAYGLVIATLILAGVVGPTLWFTVVGMALLAMSQFGVLRSFRRTDEARRPDGPPVV